MVGILKGKKKIVKRFYKIKGDVRYGKEFGFEFQCNEELLNICEYNSSGICIRFEVWNNFYCLWRIS